MSSNHLFQTFCQVLLIFGFGLLISSIYGQQSSVCPDYVSQVIKRIGGCKAVECDVGLTSDQCPTGSTLEDNVALCGCCPGCVKYEKGYLESCDIASDTKKDEYDPTCNDFVCPILRHCKPGLDCTRMPTGTTTCQPTTDIVDCRNTCFIKKAVIEYENALFTPRQRRHLPMCTQEGKFVPKQCKGSKNEGDCFCVDECGERIFGRQLYDRADNMTCACSTLVHKLRTKNNRMATLHCTENGDFESLQCDTDSSLCYCVDEITGKTTGEVMPEHQLKLLPCYNATSEDFDANSQYLRVCESEWVAGEKISREAVLHGLSFNHRPLECDYDGGYAPKFRDTANSQESCVHRSGKRILDFFRVYVETPLMDCQCARDAVYKPRYGIPFLLACQAGTNLPGSYKLFYTTGNSTYCVDKDGYQFGPDVPTQFACCLDKTCSNTIDPQCPTDNPLFPYLECTSYAYGRT